MGFKVAAERCDQCLFSRDAIVDEKRRRGILRDCARGDKHFICHKFTMVGQEACCRAFYDRDPGATNLMRIAHRLNAVEFVELPS
jgi:hypothetical protein